MSSDRKDVGTDDDACQYSEEHSADCCLGRALAHAGEHDSDRGLFDGFAWVGVLFSGMEDDQERDREY